MIIFHDVTYAHPGRDALFSRINLSIAKSEKIALTGHNGTGKSTLLQLVSGHLSPSSGVVKVNSRPYYVPQLLGRFDDYTVAEVLRVEDKLDALKQILAGGLTDKNFEILDDDWSVEERCKEAFAHWNLAGIDLNQKMKTLSGGQKTKVLLAGIMIHEPEIILLDEPSNHLDSSGRDILYNYIKSAKATLMVVSHDRTLLNLLTKVYELSERGISVYGGNYDFYAAQKATEYTALYSDLKSKEKALRTARATERDAIERQQKLDARGKKKQEKAGLPTIAMKTLKNNAEKSTSRIKGVHDEKVGSIAEELTELRRALPDLDKMKLDLDHSSLHNGKVLVRATGLNFRYRDHFLWDKALEFQVTSGDRIALKGANGCGKTTLVKIILGELQPAYGTVNRAEFSSMYIDQDYSLINDTLTVYEQAQQFNSGALLEHDVRVRLNRFLFGIDDLDKPCMALSGGEKMRLMLCALTISNQAPDVMILDEPTNNLDMQSIDILTMAVKEYRGTLLVISHDVYFLEEIDVREEIVLG